MPVHDIGFNNVFEDKVTKAQHRYFSEAAWDALRHVSEKAAALGRRVARDEYRLEGSVVFEMPS
jgi:hypothetical protein